MRPAADFTAALMRDSRIGGVLEQRTLGMLALPASITDAEGRPAADVRGFGEAFPEAEQQKLLAWGIMLGFGWARREFYVADGEIQARIRTWHSRWFQWRDDTRCWYVQARTADRKEFVWEPIRLGDGWIRYTPFGEIEPWQYGLWHRVAVPYLAKTYAIDDRSRDNEVTPILVGEMKGTEEQRKTFLDQLANVGRDSRVVINKADEQSLSVVSKSDGSRSTSLKDTIAWADQEITITIAGQLTTTEGSEGFSSGRVQKSVLASILKAQEETFSTCIGEQALTPYAQVVHGYDGPTLYLRWRIQDAEDLFAQGYALAQFATALEPVNRALSADNQRVNVAALVAQTGLPLLSVPVSTEQSTSQQVQLAPTDIARVLTVDEARASVGLAALLLPDGSPDPRGGKTIAEIAMAMAQANPEVGAPQPQPPTLQTRSRDGLRQCARLTFEITGEEPPDRFLIFAWGNNVSDKGDAILDEAGVKEILSRLGNRECMLDLEHLSTDKDRITYDPDARAWFKVEVTDRGLEAVDVRWTADGERRIRAKLQRYTSPAFYVDSDDRIVDLFNVALTALPATRYITPLVAASKTAKEPNHMNEEQLAKAREMLGLPPDAPAESVYAALLEKCEMAPDEEAVTATDDEEAVTATDDEEAVTATDDGPESKELAKMLSKVLQQNEKIIQRQDSQERETLIAANRGKLPGALKEWAKTQPIAALKAFLKNAPTVESTDIRPPQNEQPTELPAEHLQLCNRFGTNPDLVKKILARQAAEGN
jgi:phage I-like protein